MRSGAVCRAVLLLLLAVLSYEPVAAQEEYLFEAASSGVLDLAGQSRLSIEGFHGTVFVRAGKAGELRYSAATRAARREAHDVALWLRGGTMIFRPVEGREDAELILEVALSEGVDLTIVKRGGKVQVASVLGDVTVDAVDSEVDIRGAGAGVNVRLERGSLRLESIDGPTNVDGKEPEAVTLGRVSGRTRFVASGTTVQASNLGGVFEIDLEDVSFDVDTSVGRVEGNAVRSRLGLQSVRGGILELEETPLVLTRCRGKFEIATDADVSFTALSGSLAVTGYGGAVTGDGHSGEVTIDNRDSKISLSNVTGPLKLKGTALSVGLSEIANLVTAELSDSEVVAEKIRGGIELTNEFGDVTVHTVEGVTKIVSRNGNVTARELSGTVEIEAEGPEVRVAWRQIGRDQDSRIENKGGDLFVDFPSGGGARVEAEADSIETELPDVRVEDDGRSAHGLVGEVDKPTVVLKSSGRLVLSRGEGQ